MEMKLIMKHKSVSKFKVFSLNKMLDLALVSLSIPVAPSPPNFPPWYQDTWSEQLQQYIDWVDTLSVLPKSLEYIAYLGND